jgi:ribosomal protein L7/L12
MARALARRFGMSALLEEVRELLGRRRRVEAIKRVREVTRVGLKEAKEAVDAVERGETPLLESEAPGGPTGPPPSFWQEVHELIASGRLIEAIRQVREKTRMGLKEAKDTVEALAAGRPPPGHAASLLPERCPGCGAAQSPLKVRWLAPEIAECPFCGTHHLCR